MAKPSKRDAQAAARQARQGRQADAVAKIKAKIALGGYKNGGER